MPITLPFTPRGQQASWQLACFSLMKMDETEIGLSLSTSKPVCAYFLSRSRSLAQRLHFIRHINRLPKLLKWLFDNNKKNCPGAPKLDALKLRFRLDVLRIFSQGISLEYDRSSNMTIPVIIHTQKILEETIRMYNTSLIIRLLMIGKWIFCFIMFYIQQYACTSIWHLILNTVITLFSFKYRLK